MRYSYAKSSKPQKEPEAPRRMGVLYLRVSSKEQELEGFSIPAQRKLLEAYAAKEGITVAAVFEDVETAKKSGRKSFKAMLEYLSEHPEARHVLVEKTDRLYRNFTDYCDLDKLPLEIHLVKEGEVLNEHSRSHQKLVHGFKVLMAKNYIDNLSEEVTKGMLEKAEGGDFPVKAPTGYLNDKNLKRIVVDPDRGHIVRQAFEQYATGDYSITDIRRMMIDMGFTQRGTGKAPPRSSIELMLKNPFYYGEFRWRGKLHRGNHQPLISRHTFDRVQDLLSGKGPGDYQERQFAFGQFLKCANCGCTITAEIKKEKYVYYHCTNGRGGCEKPKLVPEKHLCAQFADVLKAIELDETVVAWIQEALNESSLEEQAYHEAEVSRLREEIARNKARLEQMYMDKLDGQVDEAFWRTKSEDWKKQIRRAELEIESHQVADERFHALARETLELARSAHSLFIQQTPHEQRELLHHVLSNCFLRGENIEPEYRKPFDLLAYAAKHIFEEKGASGGKNPEAPVKWA
ncbi:MAG TPA: recombinase family protein [Oscillatoriaceae cyanobacterium]